MVPYFPQKIAHRAILVYLISLSLVSVFYVGYMMPWSFILLGILWVAGFFLLTNRLTETWRAIPEKVFVRRIFWVAVALRLVWVVASYYYYIEATGQPFEFGAADSASYHDEAAWLAESNWSFIWDYYFGSFGVSDVGYSLYLTVIYKIFGPAIIVPRIFKAFLSAYTCVLLYRLSQRTFGEDTGRMVGIMSVLMMNLIVYCGYHLKETEMLFLEVAFLERADYMFRREKANLWHILVPSLLALSMFFFRTVLGTVAVFSFATAVLLMNTPSMKRGWKRLALVGWGLLCLLVLSGGTIMTEVEGYWERKEENLERKRYQQTVRGNQWAQYATGAVMAPMVFVLPFSTMVDVAGQYGQQEKHGGNFIRNFMGFFAIMGVFEALRRKKWRDFALIGSFVIAYLGIVSVSGYGNAERFLLPGLPGLIIIWGYGISTLRRNTFKLLVPWSVVVVAMEFAWAFFKLGSRGLF